MDKCVYEPGLLSIIVPVYNAEKYLPELLESLVSQTYPHKEIILIDDGSTDRSSEICDECAAKNYFVRVIHKENGGVTAARNMGLEEARGEYITMPDNDDVIDHQGYEIMIDALIKTDSEVAACCYKLERFKKIVTVSKHKMIPEPYIYDGSANVLAGLASKDKSLIRCSGERLSAVYVFALLILLMIWYFLLKYWHKLIGLFILTCRSIIIVIRLEAIPKQGK